jgi:hypothetical protein
MGGVARFRHRVHLSRTADKLRRLLERFRFGTASAAAGRVAPTAEEFAYGGAGGTAGGGRLSRRRGRARA